MAYRFHNRGSMKVSPTKQSFTPFAHPYLLTQPVALGDGFSTNHNDSNSKNTSKNNAQQDRYAIRSVNSMKQKSPPQNTTSSLIQSNIIPSTSSRTTASSSTAPISNKHTSAHPISDQTEPKVAHINPAAEILAIIQGKSISAKHIHCASFFISGMLLMFYLLHLSQ